MDVEPYFEDIHERDWQTTADTDLRLAVLGLGNFARNVVLPSLSDASLCSVTTLISGSPAKAERVADEYGIDHVLDYEAFREGTGTDAYDAVYVGGPNAFHHKNGSVAAEQGKHVIVEKPITATRDQAETLVERCESAGVTLMVAYRPQAEPVLRRVRSFVRDGGIGEVVQVHAGFSGHILAVDADTEQWRLDAELAGGGALLDVGVYPLNTTRFLLDDDPVAVQATTTSDHAAFEDVEEHVAFQLEFPDGATASCTASYNAHPDNQVHLLGTEGSVTVNPAYDAQVQPTVTVERGEETAELTPPFVDEVREEFEYFADCIASGTRPEPDGRDSLVDMATVEAVYESATTGRRVEIDRPGGDS